MRPHWLFVHTLTSVLSAYGCGLLVGVDYDKSTLDDGDAGFGTGLDGCTLRACDASLCGLQDDGCGGVLECGECGGDASRCRAGRCECTPKRCPELGLECGGAADGCSGTADCGACGTAGDDCVDGACVCTPKTCTQLEAECGNQPDTCGNVIDCRPCEGGLNCGGGGFNRCGPNECLPRRCEDIGKNCGIISDGCGQTPNCGSCSGRETCGGGGIPNVCGCTPKTCAQLGIVCGSVADDGCGNVLECPGCVAPETCGGGGVPNACGCTPKTCADLGKNCGSHPDGCGGVTPVCGACASPDICANGVCGPECTPRTREDACAGQCGVVPSGCPNVPAYDCGGCEAVGQYYQCQNNQCVCVPRGQEACGNAVCGEVSNGCGGVVSCGACGAPRTTCVGGFCQCPPSREDCGPTCCPAGRACLDPDTGRCCVGGPGDCIIP